jgi:hypothetical protein
MSSDQTQLHGLTPALSSECLAAAAAFNKLVGDIDYLRDREVQRHQLAIKQIDAMFISLDKLGKLLRDQANTTPKESIPVSTKKIARANLLTVITSQLVTGQFSKPCISYKIKDFRNHCRPMLPLTTADLEEDTDGSPKWMDRFLYAHSQIAENLGHERIGVGEWMTPCA